MRDRPSWWLLYALGPTVAAILFVLHEAGLRGIWENRVIVAALVCIPLLAFIWLQANRQALLLEGAHRRGTYVARSIPAAKGIPVDVSGQVWTMGDREEPAVLHELIDATK